MTKLKTFSRTEVDKLHHQVCKKLELEIKNIKYFAGHDGMQGINADLYHQGKKFAHAYDDAYGGEMDISPIDNEASFNALNLITNELKKLPEYRTRFTEDSNGKPIGGEPISYITKVDLEGIVNYLADYKETLKLDKKGIRFTENNKEFVIQWKSTIPTMLKKAPKQTLRIIQNEYDILKAKKDIKIKNTEYLKQIGIKL